MRLKKRLKLTRSEWELVLDALENDDKGRWGDARHEALKVLTVKVAQGLGVEIFRD